MEQDKTLIKTYIDKENNILRIYRGNSEKIEYSDEVKYQDNVFFVETVGKHRISFKCLEYLGYLLVNNCVYFNERKKRAKQLEHIIKLDEWM